MTARSTGIAAAVTLLTLVLSCNLDTTPPGELPHFAPAWQLVSIDGQPLPDTLALTLENSPPNTLHEIEAGAIEFTFPAGLRHLRWTFVLRRLSDTLRFAFSFDANYVQIGADSLLFPTSRSVPPEFFGGKAGDSLRVVTIWLQDNTTPAALVGGSHTWRFARDTLIK
jgi:hypothetical protein